ncbi:MAG: peptide chain release factor N(5)-glutamine methyltransferase, partial [Altererythrobacter ishigakiensis]|nr:peptide chain release factor N(5)-glutamine methyltransferase [Altererythrobacter ishigakiensis]
MSVANALREATAKLTETSDTARLDAELLMAHALGVMRSDMLLRHMKDAVREQFVELVSRRALREPIAYILGNAEFYGRSFIVTPHVLNQPSESESVIDAALREAPQAGRVLDMGTGSGALLLTILAETPGLEGVGIDASLGA